MRPTMKRVSCLLVAFFALGRAHAFAQDQVPPAVEAAIVVHVLASDPAFVSRTGNVFTIGLLFRPGAPSSANLAALEAYGALKAQPIDGLTVQAAGRAYRDRGDLEDWIGREGIQVLRVGSGLDTEAVVIKEVCETRKVVCASTEPELLKQGFALAVTLRDAKPRLLLNLKGAKAQGLDPDPKVVRVADVVK